MGAGSQHDDPSTPIPEQNDKAGQTQADHEKDRVIEGSGESENVVDLSSKGSDDDDKTPD